MSVRARQRDCKQRLSYFHQLLVSGSALSLFVHHFQPQLHFLHFQSRAIVSRRSGYNHLRRSDCWRLLSSRKLGHSAAKRHACTRHTSTMIAMPKTHIHRDCMLETSTAVDGILTAQHLLSDAAREVWGSHQNNVLLVAHSRLHS